MSSIREVLRVIGLPGAISWPVFWVSVVSTAAGNLTATSDAVNVPTRLLFLTVGQLVMTVPLIIVRYTLLRDPYRSRPVVVICSWLGAAVVRSFVMSWLTDIFVGPQELGVARRALLAMLFNSTVLLSAAFAVNALRERRARIATLLLVQQELDEALARGDAAATQSTEESAQRIRDLLVAEFMKIDVDQTAESLAHLRSTASDVIRPLSHRLANDLPLVEERLAGPKPTPSIADAMEVALVRRPFRPMLTFVILSLTIPCAILVSPDMWTLMILPLPVALLLAALNRVVDSLSTGRSRTVRIAIVVVSGLLAGIVGGLLAHAVIPLGADDPRRNAFSIAMFVLVELTITGTVVATTLRDQQRIIDEEEYTTTTLARLLVRQRQARWFQSQSLARLLHGPIQSAVMAAAQRIAAITHTGEVPDAVLAEVKTDLLATVGLLDEPGERSIDFATGLRRLEATWGDLYALAFTVAPGVAALIDSQPVLRATAIDIVIEACSNAIHHGGAARLFVDIALDDAEYGRHDVLVTVRSDGREDPEMGQPGLGSRMLDDCTLVWSLTVEDGMQVPHARLPVVVLGERSIDA